MEEISEPHVDLCLACSLVFFPNSFCRLLNSFCSFHKPNCVLLQNFCTCHAFCLNSFLQNTYVVYPHFIELQLSQSASCITLSKATLPLLSLSFSDMYTGVHMCRRGHVPCPTLPMYSDILSFCYYSFHECNMNFMKTRVSIHFVHCCSPSCQQCGQKSVDTVGSQ